MTKWRASLGVDIATSSFYQEKDAKVTGKNKDSCGKVDDGSFRAVAYAVFSG